MVMAEMSTFGIFRGRMSVAKNVQGETSVAEMSVAEMSDYQQNWRVIWFVMFPREKDRL